MHTIRKVFSISFFQHLVCLCYLLVFITKFVLDCHELPLFDDSRQLSFSWITVNQKPQLTPTHGSHHFHVKELSRTIFVWVRTRSESWCKIVSIFNGIDVEIFTFLLLPASDLSTIGISTWLVKIVLFKFYLITRKWYKSCWSNGVILCGSCVKNREKSHLSLHVQ